MNVFILLAVTMVLDESMPVTTCSPACWNEQGMPIKSVTCWKKAGKQRPIEVLAKAPTKALMSSGLPRCCLHNTKTVKSVRILHMLAAAHLK